MVVALAWCLARSVSGADTSKPLIWLIVALLAFIADAREARRTRRHSTGPSFAFGTAVLSPRIRSVSSVPIIMLAEHNHEDTIVEALMAGAEDYLSQPVSTHGLVARIRTVLRRFESQDIGDGHLLQGRPYSSGQPCLSGFARILALRCTGVPTQAEVMGHAENSGDREEWSEYQCVTCYVGRTADDESDGPPDDHEGDRQDDRLESKAARHCFILTTSETMPSLLEALSHVGCGGSCELSAIAPVEFLTEFLKAKTDFLVQLSVVQCGIQGSLSPAMKDRQLHRTQDPQIRGEEIGWTHLTQRNDRL